MLIVSYDCQFKGSHIHVPIPLVQMESVKNGGSDLFTAYGLELVTTNLDISNEVYNNV